MKGLGMTLDIQGLPTQDKHIRVGFIGCGGHSFRNIFPAFQFAPVELVATCDLDIDKAKAYGRQFGASGGAYDDYHVMLEEEDLDAVFVVVGYSSGNRPLYPPIAVDCMNAGCHVFIEKPPAGACADVETMQEVSDRTGRIVMTAFKKMFFPANRKARRLIRDEAFGTPTMLTLEYPQHLPTVDDWTTWFDGGKSAVIGLCDHLCHPVSIMLMMLGMPQTLYYKRNRFGGGAATFGFADGEVCTLTFTHGGSHNLGMERTVIYSDRHQHVAVENGIRVIANRFHHTPYGTMTDYYSGPDSEAALVWEPEFSLGQLYNKALFIEGFVGEVTEFAHAVLQGRQPEMAHLEHAWQATRIFEAFAQGEGHEIEL